MLANPYYYHHNNYNYNAFNIIFVKLVRMTFKDKVYNHVILKVAIKGASGCAKGMQFVADIVV